jgi:5-methylcytosine-specific restriction endonuclease McrA
MSSKLNRYPKNWKAIALKIKEKANWKCDKCGLQCLKPSDSRKGLTRSEISKITLTVHHRNYQPEDNSENNLIALCSGCHLSYHARKRGNMTIGQLSLF